MKHRPRWLAVVSAVAVVGLIVVGCAKYKGPADAYTKSADERATADKRLRKEAGEVSVPSFGAAQRATADFCMSHPMGTVGGSDTVNCEANLRLAYTRHAGGTSAGQVWPAEQAALRTMAQTLDDAGWKVSGAELLDESLNDSSYDPYPLEFQPAGKRPVQLWLDLVDTRTHPYDAFGRPRMDALPTLDSSTFLVTVTFRNVYVSEEKCSSECSMKTPTAWPTRYDQP